MPCNDANPTVNRYAGEAVSGASLRQSARAHANLSGFPTRDLPEPDGAVSRLWVMTVGRFGGTLGRKPVETGPV